MQLTDLGTNQQHTAVGTTQYMAPEVMQEGGSYGRKVGNAAHLFTLSPPVLNCVGTPVCPPLGTRRTFGALE